AAAMPARSLSVKDNASMSAGAWRRSMGSTRSSSVADDVARRCILPRQCRRYLGAADALLADHHEAPAALLLWAPGAVVVVIDARADGLDQKPHGLAGDRHETLYPQHLLGLGYGGDSGSQLGRVRRLGHVHDEGVELVVVVVFLVVVMGAAVVDVVLDAEPEAHNDLGIDLAVADRDHSHGRAQMLRNHPLGAGAAFLVDQVAFR